MVVMTALFLLVWVVLMPLGRRVERAVSEWLQQRKKRKKEADA